MQQLWERVGDRQDKLHQDTHQEHNWMKDQVSGLRGSMEKHFAALMAQLEGFTQELKPALTCATIRGTRKGRVIAFFSIFYISWVVRCLNFL
jgi:hypothetical protein